MTMGRLLKTKYGEMYLPINARYEKEHANYEFEKGFVDVLKNDDYYLFVDIGAGWGYHTAVASRNCYEVLAFEPHISRYEILKKNVEDLKLKNVQVSNKAVGTGNKKLWMNESEKGMVGPHSGVRKTPVEVEWISLKEVLKSYKGFITIVKIDVEGNEIDVIKSIGNLENYSKLTFLIERHERKDFGYNEETLFRHMQPFKGELVGVRKWTSHYVFRKD